jgi:hypothetical protein
MERKHDLEELERERWESSEKVEEMGREIK